MGEGTLTLMEVQSEPLCCKKYNPTPTRTMGQIMKQAESPVPYRQVFMLEQRKVSCPVLRSKDLCVGLGSGMARERGTLSQLGTVAMVNLHDQNNSGRKGLVWLTLPHYHSSLKEARARTKEGRNPEAGAADGFYFKSSIIESMSFPPAKRLQEPQSFLGNVFDQSKK